MYLLSRGRIGSRARDGVGILVLTTRGRRSGRIHAVALRFVPYNNLYLVIASNRGDGRHPDWYANVRANPSVSVQIGAKRFDAAARTLLGAERAAAWSHATQAYAGWTRYQSLTSRELPVVGLPSTGARIDP